MTNSAPKAGDDTTKSSPKLEADAANSHHAAPPIANSAVIRRFQSALSQHLAKMRTRDLVKTRRDAQAIYYSIKSEPVLKMLRTLSEIYCR